MVRPMAHGVRELWDIRYLHSYGRLGSALVDRMARRGPPSEPVLAGTVIAFASMRARAAGSGWTVVACIDFGPHGTIFGRVVAERPWTSRTIRSHMKIGHQVVPAASGPEVLSLADIVFVLVD